MRAIQSTEVGKATIVDVAEPELLSNTILVRSTFVANNPCDYLILDIPPMFVQGQTVGCDYSGVVEKIGSDVQTSLKPGDKAFGVVASGVGVDVSRGAFGELIPAYGHYCFALPNGSDEAGAATLGVALSTICISFYLNFGFPMPVDDPHFGDGKPFLVYAGSTTTGLMAIQFAKMSGFRVLTTCSPRNFDLVKSRGADEVYDYHDLEQCARDIKDSVGDELQYAYICILGDDPAKLCAQVLSSKGGKYVTVVGGSCPREDIETIMTYGSAAMCSPYMSQTGPTEQTPEQKTLPQKFWKWALKLLEEGRIQPPPYELRDGLEGALKGIDDLREGTVSGKKIVSRLV